MPINRREFLHTLGSLAGSAGSLWLGSGLAVSLPGIAAASPNTQKNKARAQSVIQIFLPGGMASQESFDPKPSAPIEFRGELKAIKTKVPGVQFSELLKKTANIADKLVICRSMTHGEADHDRGTHNMWTGYRPSPAVIYPSLGSVVSHKFGTRNNLPAYICVPNQPTTFAGSGYLPASTAPFSLGSDPARNNFEVRDLNRPGGIKGDRAKKRREYLDLVNGHLAGRVEDGGVKAMDEFYRRAQAMIDSKSAREAFNLKAEPKKFLDRYGKTQPGMRMLMARRLVEAGARYVSVTYGGWDMHDKITAGFKRLMPSFDQAFAALIADLDARGLLATTLVMVTSEFGRTPKLNKTGGRDHWPKVFSIVMAGGGLKSGIVHGATDATATEPAESPLTVENWASTVYHLLGINSKESLMAPGNRPVALVKDGSVEKNLLA